MNRRVPIQTGPRTWALAREDYLRGDSGPAVCKRYGIRIDAFRARCWREGWSKRDHAALVEIDRLGPLPEPPPRTPECGDKSESVPLAAGLGAPVLEAGSAAAPSPAADPKRAVRRAVRAAAEALGEGRALEAQALIKAAEGLSRLCVQVGPLPEPEEPWVGALRAGHGLPRDIDAYDAFASEVWALAGEVALEMLSAAPDPVPIHARAVFAWRARHLGAKVAAADLQRARDGGWAERVFDPSGRVLPLEITAALRQSVEGALGVDHGVEGS